VDDNVVVGGRVLSSRVGGRLYVAIRANIIIRPVCFLHFSPLLASFSHD
jgi:hypothetical protein